MFILSQHTVLQVILISGEITLYMLCLSPVSKHSYSVVQMLMNDSFPFGFLFIKLFFSYPYTYISHDYYCETFHDIF